MKCARFGVAAILLLSTHADGRLWQQGPKLVGAGFAGQANQGNAVSLSADGNTAIVGGVSDDGLAGAAWVWTRSGGVWTQQGGKLVGGGAVGTARQGVSAALSADGNTAIVGGYTDASGAGAAWVWTRSGGVWTQQGGKLVGSGAMGNANQGYSVALSNDGNTATVGGPWDDGGAGAVWVFSRSGGVWTQQGGKLVANDGLGGSWAGESVSLSADGNTAIVGGSGDADAVGAAWVWTRSGGVWTQQGSKLVGSGVGPGSFLGSEVALSADGNTAMAGGYMDGLGEGGAWVWTRSGGVWTQQGGRLVGSGAASGAHQGSSVSLSADGDMAIVGGLADAEFVGATWVWTRTGGTWTQQGSKIVGSPAASLHLPGHLRRPVGLRRHGDRGGAGRRHPGRRGLGLLVGAFFLPAHAMPCRRHTGPRRPARRPGARRYERPALHDDRRVRRSPRCPRALNEPHRDAAGGHGRARPPRGRRADARRLDDLVPRRRHAGEQRDPAPRRRRLGNREHREPEPGHRPRRRRRERLLPVGEESRSGREAVAPSAPAGVRRRQRRRGALPSPRGAR